MSVISGRRSCVDCSHCNMPWLHGSPPLSPAGGEVSLLRAEVMRLVGPSGVVDVRDVGGQRPGVGSRQPGMDYGPGLSALRGVPLGRGFVAAGPAEFEAGGMQRGTLFAGASIDDAGVATLSPLAPLGAPFNAYMEEFPPSVVAELVRESRDGVDVRMHVEDVYLAAVAAPERRYRIPLERNSPTVAQHWEFVEGEILRILKRKQVVALGDVGALAAAGLMVEDIHQLTVRTTRALRARVSHGCVVAYVGFVPCSLCWCFVPRWVAGRAEQAPVVFEFTGVE